MKDKFWENPYNIAFIILLPVWIPFVIIAWVWTGFEKCIDRMVDRIRGTK